MCSSDLLTHANMEWIDPAGKRMGTTDVGPADRLPVGNCFGASFMYRREVHDSLGGYKNELFMFEVYDFWLRALLSGFRIRKISALRCFKWVA